MKNNTKLQLFLFSLLLIIATAGITSLVLQSPVGNSILLSVPHTNCEIRNWYNYQTIALSKQNEYWKANGIPLKERAMKAYFIRHHARLEARFMMPNKSEVAQREARDQKKYGSPDGPTFDYLVQENLAEGKTEQEAYEAIIESASKTNATYNSFCQ